jgi:hypothetical protein
MRVRAYVRTCVHISVLVTDAWWSIQRVLQQPLASPASSKCARVCPCAPRLSLFRCTITHTCTIPTIGRWWGSAGSPDWDTRRPHRAPGESRTCTGTWSRFQWITGGAQRRMGPYRTPCNNSLSLANARVGRAPYLEESATCERVRGWMGSMLTIQRTLYVRAPFEQGALCSIIIACAAVCTVRTRALRGSRCSAPPLHPTAESYALDPRPMRL